MKIILKKKKSFTKKDNLIVITYKNSDLAKFKLIKSEIDFIKKSKKEITQINQYSRQLFIVIPKKILITISKPKILECLAINYLRK